MLIALSIISMHEAELLQPNSQGHGIAVFCLQTEFSVRYSSQTQSTIIIPTLSNPAVSPLLFVSFNYFLSHHGKRSREWCCLAKDVYILVYRVVKKMAQLLISHRFQAPLKTVGRLIYSSVRLVHNDDISQVMQEHYKFKTHDINFWAIQQRTSASRVPYSLSVNVGLYCNRATSEKLSLH